MFYRLSVVGAIFASLFCVDVSCWHFALQNTSRDKLNPEEGIAIQSLKCHWLRDYKLVILSVIKLLIT
jgi:hypothetical protein